MKVCDYTVEVKRDKDGMFLATCPALQGCYGEGATKEEALEMIEDAIKLYIEDWKEDGYKIDETEYLLATKANRENLFASIQESKEGKSIAIKTAGLWK